jgi:replicative DNA helicase
MEDNHVSTLKMMYWCETWERIDEERRAIDTSRMPTFGISALDDALCGILKNDLVVIGSDSGVGKSDMCLNMAIHNAKNGLKVGLYYLEGGANEALYRIKWKMMCDEYYHGAYNHTDMDYRKWRMNKMQSPIFDQLEQKCYEDLFEKIKTNLVVADIASGMKVADLTQSFLHAFTTIKKDEYGFDTESINCDLIIIDHLQYFDLANPKTEYAEMTEILKTVNNMCQFYKVPVILVSHLRKKDKDRGLPGQEDFFGTSNIPKISSVSITICPDFEDSDCELDKYPTWFRVVKSRTGVRSSIAFRTFFDFKRGTYTNNYELFKLIEDKPHKPIAIPDRPRWATNMTQSNRKQAGKKADINWEE